MKKLKVFLFGEKDTIAKRIVNYGLIFLVIAGFIEYGIDHNGNMSGLLEKETWEVDQTQTVVDDTVHIIGLGEIDRTILERASKIISDKFGADTKIVENLYYTEDLFYENYDKINPYYSVGKLNNGSSRKRIIITTQPMTDEDGITSVMGICNGNTILVTTISDFKATLIHEYGHSLGLNHCNDSHCVMSTYGNGYLPEYGAKFCNNCSSAINLNENI